MAIFTNQPKGESIPSLTEEERKDYSKEELAKIDSHKEPKKFDEKKFLDQGFVAVTIS